MILGSKVFPYIGQKLTQAGLAEWDHYITQHQVRQGRYRVERAMSAAELVTELNASGQALPLVMKRSGEAVPVHSALELVPGDEVVYLVRS